MAEENKNDSFEDKLLKDESTEDEPLKDESTEDQPLKDESTEKDMMPKAHLIPDGDNAGIEIQLRQPCLEPEEMIYRCKDRLQEEWKETKYSAEDFKIVGLTNPEEFVWNVKIYIWSWVAVYCQGVYTLEFKFPPSYPEERPQVKFASKIWHPNIPKTGHINPALIPELKKWTSSHTVLDIVKSIVNLLENPNTLYTLNVEAMKVFKKCKRCYGKKVYENILKYALTGTNYISAVDEDDADEADQAEDESEQLCKCNLID